VKALRLYILAAVVLFIAATPSRAQDTSSRLAVRFAARLAELSPSEPSKYLLLAEDLSDQAESPADQRLVIELYALAFEAARTRASERAVAASACRGLAAAKPTRERKWFETLAAFVDPAGAQPGWLRRPPPNSVDSTQYRIATLIGLVRSGEGSLAQQQLAKPEIRQALLGMESLLERSGISGGADGLAREAGRWPCRECNNKGFVRRANTNPPEYRTCSNCAGKPGKQLTQAELVAQLRLESWLLQGSQRSWAAQMTSDDGAPLTDPDPQALCTHVGVDAARMYWRGGHWVRNADGSDLAPDEKEPAKPKPTVPENKPEKGSAVGG